MSQEFKYAEEQTERPSIQHIFERLWIRYVSQAPQVERIRALFEARGESVINDHIAFRTLDQSPVDLSAFTRLLRGYGYEPFEEHDFPQKKLNALAYRCVTGGPKIFVSELRRAELSSETQTLLARLLHERGADPLSIAELCGARLWPRVTHAEYQRIIAESEYAGWLTAMGMTVNHFTVSVNHLTTLKTLEEVNALLTQAGFELNRAGGVIKGSSEAHLEQSSTLADQRPLRFRCGTTAEVPTCYYEFALRYPLPSGERFEGFVPASAARIFESTHRSSQT